MTVWKSGNSHFKEPPFKDGDVVEGGNWSQLIPGTQISKDIKNLTIRGGNFVNCIPQPTWIVEGGNWCQKGRCSHQHPNWIRHGLPICAEDCAHRVGTIKQWVPVDEREYVDIATSLEPGQPSIRKHETRDAQNIVRTTFEKEVYVYKDIGYDPGVTP